VIIDEDDYLAHYGILRRSGRYPWGSGGPDSPQSRTFLSTVESLRKSGISEAQIAEGMGITTTELRAAKSIANNAHKQAQIGQAQKLKDKGMSNVAIGRKMGINESSVRALLAPGQKDKADVLETTANMLQDQVAEKKHIDVGVGVERYLGISKEKLATAVARLEAEGYTVHHLKISQLGTGEKTTLKVLSAPGTTFSEVAKAKHDIKLITEHSEDGGRSFLGILPPLSVNAKRIAVRYAEDGGSTADGVIYVRPGVPDVSLGKSPYAQVRIKVDDSHYIKGMAMYKDDLPAGVDLLFNTSKSNTGHKLDAFKPLKEDEDNPFGATIRQIPKYDEHGVPIKGTVGSAMNLVNEAGNWETWSRTLSTQVISKQSPKLAKQQLDMARDRKRQQLEDILALTNPAVRKKLLDEYADSVEAAAVHLRAAALPRQANHVILPINSLKDNEVYAPTFKNGERVVLVRHPHGGIFEIPELVVNNRNREGIRSLGDSQDAIGINHKVAQRLSGADFDGDAVIVIPNQHGLIKTAPALEGLKHFDPIRSYPEFPGMTRMTPRMTGIQMGLITNLIADMSIKGASMEERARAIRHSMVVIDAEKHKLNWKQSAIDNGIPQLMAKYQGRSQGGASTLITRAKSEVRVPERKPRSAAKGGPVDKATGKRVFEPTGNTFTTSSGKVIPRTTKTTKLAEAEDAHTLSSGTKIESIYADHSNHMKELARQARLASIRTRTIPYSPSAKMTYRKEVADLDAKLNVALKNAPLERRAQGIANGIFQLKKQANPHLDKSELKRLKFQALNEARARLDAGKIRIEITDSEWAAIQAGAVSNEKLSKILDNARSEDIVRLAKPKAELKMTSSKTARAKSMLSAGYTQAEVAQHLGVSLTTLKTAIA
jgi:hypothetical protein